MSDGIREVHFVRENEVVNVLNLIERGKSPGLDGNKIVPKEGFNACSNSLKVLGVWRISHIVSVYKGKEDRSECSSYRNISLLRIPRKIYGRITIDRVVSCAEYVGSSAVWILKRLRVCEQEFRFSNFYREIS